jgi:hypothetical protein
VPDRDIGHLARTRGTATVTLMCRDPSLGVEVPDRGKGLTLMESPREVVEVVGARAQTPAGGKTSIEPCKSLREGHVVAGVTGCNM